MQPNQRPTIEVGLRFNFPQWRAWHVIGPRRTVFLGWGRGVGKSWFRRQVWWTKIAEYEHRVRTDALEPFKGFRVTSLAPTLKQWKDIHWGGIEQELSRGGRWAHLRARLDSQTGQIWFPGGGIVRPFPATAYNARTARGMRTDLLDADEVDDIDSEVYDSIATPWLSEPWSYGLELPGGTPTRGRHGLWWRTFKAGKIGERLRNGELIEQVVTDEELQRYRGLLGDDSDESNIGAVTDALKSIYTDHATYEDAPETVSQRAVARAIATTPSATFEREWRANPDAGEGLVYPFDERIHIREPGDWRSFHEFHVGGDHGWVDAGVLLLGGIRGHGNDAELWILDEWYESECPNNVWDARAKEWAKIYAPTFWLDPSRPDRINDYKAQGCHVRDTDNEINGGVARVADLLFIRRSEDRPAWTRLYVSSKCKNLIREFGLYRRKKLPDGTFDEKPEDKNNHAMDALRYMAVGRFGRPVNFRNVVSGN